jgi:hypothetical protein
VTGIGLRIGGHSSFGSVVSTAKVCTVSPPAWGSFHASP